MSASHLIRGSGARRSLLESGRARAMAPGDKLLEGARLFDRACRVMADGIRHRHPDLTEAEVLARVEAQLARVRSLDPP